MTLRLRSVSMVSEVEPLMDNHKISAIIFDLGNVLIDFDHRIAAEKISKFTDRTAQEIFELFFDSQLTGLLEEGKISPQEFFLKVKEILNLKLDYAAFSAIWNDIFFLTENNYALHVLVGILKRHYKLAVVSNINISHFEYLKKNFPIFDSFPHIITSYEIGVRKPHPLIYNKTLQTLGVLAPEVFYTDDRVELVRGACELGIRGVVFREPQQLKKDLLDAGVKMLDKDNTL